MYPVTTTHRVAVSTLTPNQLPSVMDEPSLLCKFPSLKKWYNTLPCVNIVNDGLLYTLSTCNVQCAQQLKHVRKHLTFTRKQVWCQRLKPLVTSSTFRHNDFELATVSHRLLALTSSVCYPTTHSYLGQLHLSLPLKGRSSSTLLSLQPCSTMFLMHDST